MANTNLTNVTKANSINLSIFMDALNFRKDFALEGFNALNETRLAFFYSDCLAAKKGNSPVVAGNARVAMAMKEEVLRNLYNSHLMKAIRMLTTFNARFKDETGEFFILRKIAKRDDGLFDPFDAIKFVEEFREEFKRECPKFDFDHTAWDEIANKIAA